MMMKDKNKKSAKQIHWYPGHMAGATRELKDAWRHVDLVIEVADARLPSASRNPLFLQFKPVKPHLLILSHADLADSSLNEIWLKFYREGKVQAISCDLRNSADIGRIRRACLKYHGPLLDKAKKQGRIARPLRILVAGIPNTGKSTLINQFVGKRSARVEARPGVTRSLNWLRSGKELHFLDSPGILPAKLEDRQAALCLAATGAIRDSILPLDQVAIWLFGQLVESYPKEMAARYGEEMEFEAAAQKMGCLLPGGDVDLPRFSNLLLDDFRTGRIGCLTLESPPSLNTISND